MNKLINIIILLLTVFVITFLVIKLHPNTEYEIAECEYKKQRESEVVDYYSAKWEKDMCKQYGIELKPARQSIAPEEPSYQIEY